MKKIHLLLIVFISINAFSQYNYPKQELAQQVLKSKLAIQLYSENSEEDKHSNQAIKEIFNQEWKLTEIEFFTKEEINKLKSENNKEYAYLVFDESLRSDVRSGYISPNGKITRIGVSDNPVSTRFSYTAFSFTYFEYALQVINKKDKLKNVTEICFANGELSKIDYLFITQQLERLLKHSSEQNSSKKYYDAKANIERIKSTELLLLDNFFREKDKKKMDKFYDFKYKLVNMTEYEDAILNKQAEKTYVKIIWSQHHNMYMWLVVNADNGAIVAQTGFGGVKFGRHHNANEIIKAKHLKYITSKMAQKVNSRY